MSRAYRHRIKIQRDSTADGIPDPVYADLFTGIPCHIRPRNTYEAPRGRQLEATTSHLIECRWIDGFEANDIAVNEITGDQYTIIGVINVENLSREMRIYCNEVTV